MKTSMRSLFAGIATLAFVATTALGGPIYLNLNTDVAGQPTGPIGGNPAEGSYNFDPLVGEWGAVGLVTAITPAITPDLLTVTLDWARGTVRLNNFYLKASNRYMVWDLTGITAWATYDGLTVKNTYIMNVHGVPQEISHINANGDLVPDGGATVMLIGAALAAMALLQRRR